MINMLARATDTTMFINEWFQWCIIYFTYTAIYNYLTDRGQITEFIEIKYEFNFILKLVFNTIHYLRSSVKKIPDYFNYNYVFMSLYGHLRTK